MWPDLSQLYGVRWRWRIKGMVNCRNSRDKGPPECNSARRWAEGRPYSIIMLNMRFIPKASLRASSQITATSYILKRHLWVNNSKPLALAPTWSLGCKQTDCITAGMSKLVDPKLIYWHSVNTEHLYDFIQCWTNVEDVGPTLYKCYTMCCVSWAGGLSLKQSTFVLCWSNVGPALQTLVQH